MQSRKFPNDDEAIAYLASKGTLKLFGWEGDKDGYYVYNLTIGSYVYRLRVFKSGLVEVREG